MFPVGSTGSSALLLRQNWSRTIKTLFMNGPGLVDFLSPRFRSGGVVKPRGWSFMLRLRLRQTRLTLIPRLSQSDVTVFKRGGRSGRFCLFRPWRSRRSVTVIPSFGRFRRETWFIAVTWRGGRGQIRVPVTWWCRWRRQPWSTNGVKIRAFRWRRVVMKVGDGEKIGLLLVPLTRQFVAPSIKPV